MSFGSFKVPKNDSKYYWTRHCVGKMMQYGLSPQRVKRVIRSCERVEEGVAKNTVAVMQPNSIKFDKSGKKKWSQEIWVMYQKSVKNSKFKVQNKGANSEIINNLKNKLFPQNQLKIISVWRYPGVSPKNNPIPQDILEEVNDMI